MNLRRRPERCGTPTVPERAAAQQTKKMDQVKSYIEANRERFVNELFDLLRIPSISAQSEHKPDMQRCAEHLAAALVKAGADRAEVMPTEGNPVVYAEKIVSPKAKTVLVYGHYDVMPVDPRDEWRTDPFEPVVNRRPHPGARRRRRQGPALDARQGLRGDVRDGHAALQRKIHARGRGGDRLAEPLRLLRAATSELLKADIILVSDTSMISMQTPSITCGLRGLAYMEVEVTGPDKDLHSGLFGGAVANPANVLARLVASLIDENGRVTIPGFYDDVRELTRGRARGLQQVRRSTWRPTSVRSRSATWRAKRATRRIERTGVRPVARRQRHLGRLHRARGPRR